MSNKKKTIFISSTYKDLKPHREIVWKVLRGFNVDITGMEDFGARKSAPLETCLQELQKSDIYIVIISMCYGSIDTRTCKSYTQLEYEKARELDLDILVYLIDNFKGKVITGNIDNSKKMDNLIEFKNTLMENHTVDFFIDENDLGLKINKKLNEILPKANDSEDIVRPLLLPCKLYIENAEERKWVFFVAYYKSKPFELFSVILDDEFGFFLPSEVSEGVIFKDTNELGRARYDFQFANRRGYKTTIEGIGESAPSAIIDYSKIITELLQANSPIKRIIYMLEDLILSDEMSSTWRRSVIKLLKSIM